MSFRDRSCTICEQALIDMQASSLNYIHTNHYICGSILNVKEGLRNVGRFLAHFYASEHAIEWQRWMYLLFIETM